MLKHMTFLKYLSEKGRKTDYIEKCKSLLAQFQEALNAEPLVSAALDTVTKTFYGVSKIAMGYRILHEYADFCDDPTFADEIRKYSAQVFDEEARKAVRALRNAVILIPDGTKINPKYLSVLTNDEFVDAFRSLQEMTAAIYGEIERAPSDWGWPDWGGLSVTGHHHNRVMTIFNTLAECGEIDGNALVINKKQMGKYDFIKLCKGKAMLSGLENMGFMLEGLEDKKSDTFTFSCPDTPDLIHVMCAYFGDYKDSGVFSYRFVEDPAAHKYCTYFLALTDKMPENLREIHHWLYNETAKYGFSYNAHNGYDIIRNDHIWYEKGAKRKPHELAAKNFLIYGMEKAEAIFPFRKLLQKHPEKAEELYRRFPNSFSKASWTVCKNCNSPPCKKRVVFTLDGEEHCNCKYHPFHFYDVTLDDVKLLFEMYKLE